MKSYTITACQEGGFMVHGPNAHHVEGYYGRIYGADFAGSLADCLTWIAGKLGA